MMKKKKAAAARRQAEAEEEEKSSFLPEREEKEEEEGDLLLSTTQQQQQQRPKTSPYTTPPVKFHFGSGHHDKNDYYYVPQHLLQNPKWIDSCSSPRPGAFGSFGYQQPDYDINLHDVDEDTGHVLVHYLYTGAYQTLDNVDNIGGKKKSSSAKQKEEEGKSSSAEIEEFKRAFLVYTMAKTYELADLQQLAKQKIEFYGMKMNVFDILEALNDEDFSTTLQFQDQGDWFLRDYLVEKIEVAFSKDYATFAKNDDFLDWVGSNVALNKFVVRHVMELYTGKVSRLLNTEKEEEEVIRGFSDGCVPAVAQYSPVDEDSAKVSVAIEEVPVADYSVHEGRTQQCSVPECSVPECSIPECSVPECSVPECSVPECSVPEYSVPECSIEDFAVEEAPVQWAFHEETVAADTVNAVSIEQAPVTDENPFGDVQWASLATKATKKKKKGVAATIDEFIPEPAPEHEKPDEKDRWSFAFGNAMNKENKKIGAFTIKDAFVNHEPACEPARKPEPEAAKEADFWRVEPISTGKKIKKAKKGAIGESAAVIEDTSAKPELGSKPVIEPEPEAVREDAVLGSSSFSIDKKKKGKKGIIGKSKTVVEDISFNPELEPEAVKEDAGWGFSSLSASKKKKVKKGVIGESTTLIGDISVNPELELEAVKEDAGWGISSFSASSKKKGKKSATKVVEDEPNMEELAPPPLEPALLADDGWGTSMMPDKKKKSKKSTTQKALVIKSSSSHSELELGTEHKPEKKASGWAEWDTPDTWKMKDSKDKEEPQAIIASAGREQDDGPQKVEAIINEPNISPASPHAEQQVENSPTSWTFTQSEQVEKHVISSNGHSDFQAEAEPQPLKIENGICPNRAKHLLEGDQWKTCRQCRAVLRQVAIQLVTMGHAAADENENENEYEMVDHILTAE